MVFALSVVAVKYVMYEGSKMHDGLTVKHFKFDVRQLICED